MKGLLKAFTIIGVIHSGSLSALNSGSPHDQISRAEWINAIQTSGVESELLYAIALQESGNSFKGMRAFRPWPWSMNDRGKAVFFSNKKSLQAYIKKQIQDGNDRIDIGMWQINVKYNGHLVDEIVSLADPKTNLRVAALVLESCGKKYGTARKVIACYHSGDTDERGLRYADKVVRLAGKWARTFKLDRSVVQAKYTARNWSREPVERKGTLRQLVKASKTKKQEKAEKKKDMRKTEMNRIADSGSVENYGQFVERVKKNTNQRWVISTE